MNPKLPPYENWTPNPAIAPSNDKMSQEEERKQELEFHKALIRKQETLIDSLRVELLQVYRKLLSKV